MNDNWESYTVTDWTDFTKCIDQFIQPRPNEINRFLFRGQVNAEWRLVTSFNRICQANEIGEELAVKLERKALGEFITQAHLHFDSSTLPKNMWNLNWQQALEWWQFMQHYNAPTRLLDWTKSLYVAAYFAVEKDFKSSGAIWIVEPGAILDRMRELEQRERCKFGLYTSSDNKPKQIHFCRPTRPSNRMVAQQGWFSVASHIYADQSEIIEEAVKDHLHRKWIYKVIIPGHMKEEFLGRLRTMNITASSLFPGADGLGRSIAELICLKQWID